MARDTSLRNQLRNPTGNGGRLTKCKGGAGGGKGRAHDFGLAEVKTTNYWHYLDVH